MYNPWPTAIEAADGTTPKQPKTAVRPSYTVGWRYALIFISFAFILTHMTFITHGFIGYARDVLHWKMTTCAGHFFWVEQGGAALALVTLPTIFDRNLHFRKINVLAASITCLLAKWILLAINWSDDRIYTALAWMSVLFRSFGSLYVPYTRTFFSNYASSRTQGQAMACFSILRSLTYFAGPLVLNEYTEAIETPYVHNEHRPRYLFWIYVALCGFAALLAWLTYPQSDPDFGELDEVYKDLFSSASTGRSTDHSMPISMNATNTPEEARRSIRSTAIPTYDEDGYVRDLRLPRPNGGGPLEHSIQHKHSLSH